MMRRLIIIQRKEKLSIKNSVDSSVKVYQVITDGGICKNMVCREMVEKFNLQSKKHPHPFYIACFKKGNKVILNRRYLVRISIEIAISMRYGVIFLLWMYVIFSMEDHRNIKEILFIMGRKILYLLEGSF